LVREPTRLRLAVKDRGFVEEHGHIRLAGRLDERKLEIERRIVGLHACQNRVPLGGCVDVLTRIRKGVEIQKDNLCLTLPGRRVGGSVVQRGSTEDSYITATCLDAGCVTIPNHRRECRWSDEREP